MIRFKFLTGDSNWQVYGGKFVSQKLSNGEFDYWLVMDVINMHESAGDEKQAKYYVGLQAVSPEQAGKKGLDSAFSCMGLSDDQIEKWESDSLMQVEALSEYGIFAMLWQESGNNLKALMKQAREQAQCINGLFGFYMDRPENGIGQDGWQLIRGQDIREFLGVNNPA